MYPSRSASKQEIVKAYRKAAQKWHPDNFQGDEKKIAEKKFIDVAAAKEVGSRRGFISTDSTHSIEFYSIE